jgi:cyanophycin synthetase
MVDADDSTCLETSSGVTGCSTSIRAFRLLRGANVHWRETVVEALIDVAEHSMPGETMIGFLADLYTWLPCLDITASGLERGRVVAHAVGRVTLELQRRVEIPVTFTRTEPAELPGTYRVTVAYQQEETARAALDTAMRLVRSALAHQPVDIARELEQLMELADCYRLGPSAATIVAAAQERGIPAIRLQRRGHLVQLGWGVHQKHIEVTETLNTSAIAVRRCKKKPVTNALLRTLGIPVPVGRAVQSAEEAWQVAMEIGLPVVTKPEAGKMGKGVSAGLKAEEQVRAGYDVAASYILRGKFRGNVLVERHIEGNEYRLLVVNGSLVAASQRHPAQVAGDGQRTIRELVDIVNRDPRRRPKRGELFPIVLDEAASLALAQQGLAFDSIPKAGQVVRVRQNSNLSCGGSATDVTESVHPFNAQMAELAARALGVDVAGVDVVCHDISRPMNERGGAIIEVNAQPGFQMHLFPTEGQPRQVGRPIVDMLFPAGTGGRIPLIAILAARDSGGLGGMVARVYEAEGQIVGLSTPEGASVAGRRLEPSDSSQQASTRALLLHPLLEALVVETTPETIVDEGLAFDRCEIAIVTSPEPGESINGTSDWLRAARVLAQSVDRVGTLILNADEQSLTDAVGGSLSVIYTSAGRQNESLYEHRARGGRCVLLRESCVILAEGAREIELMRVRQGGPGGGMAWILSAVAAGWAAGFPPRVFAQAFAADEVGGWTSSSERAATRPWLGS